MTRYHHESRELQKKRERKEEQGAKQARTEREKERGAAGTRKARSDTRDAGVEAIQLGFKGQ